MPGSVLDVDTDTSEEDNNDREEKQRGYTIYEPTFQNEVMTKVNNDKLDYKEAHEWLMKKDWLTKAKKIKNTTVQEELFLLFFMPPHSVCLSKTCYASQKLKYIIWPLSLSC